ncbi:heat induced stress protein yflt [Trichococcus palustris]|uniref:Heat induced stress protein yflt n=1 Tax=Trichococcus palustris TaxID=140314 RepID=A0A143YS78_9LACT|nr:general stress protein [Trichococcus palustris]CZQ97238.1 heat induced stress protein yflt [Trichococcus palustris]SFK75841.1 Heat induced stress protein YflT [Trichococcus palustris]
MDKRIDGTFVNQELVIEEINHLIKEEGYAPEQLLVLTRKAKNDFITTETGVQVVLTGEDHDDDSLWDKIVNFFTVDMDEEEEEKIFESYGIDEDTYERFEDAMENGELLLLIDDAAPVNEEHADFLVRDGILPDEHAEEKKAMATQPDWAADDTAKGDMPTHAIEAEKESQAVAAGMTESQADMKEAEPVAHEEMNEMVVREEYEVAEIPKEKTATVSGESEKQPDLKDIVTDQPIKTAAVAGDPTMAEDNHEMADMQFDKEESLPELDETDGQYSKDPFGGETVAAEEGEDADDIPPVYENPDKKRPAL